MNIRKKILLACTFFLLIAGYSNCSGSGFKVESSLSSVSGQGEVKNSDPSNPAPNPAPNPGSQGPLTKDIQIQSLSNSVLESTAGAVLPLNVRLRYSGPSLGTNYQVFLELVSAANPNSQGILKLSPLKGPASSQWMGTMDFSGSMTVPAAGNYLIYAGVNDSKITKGVSSVQIEAGSGVTANYTSAYGYRYQVGTLAVKAPTVNKNLGRVMPIGDSITAPCGSCGFPVTPTAYRKPLAEKLTAAGFTFQYVGNENDGTYQHEGHGGWCLTKKGTCPAGLLEHLSANNADKLLNTISANPDTVLLMAGANDSWQFTLSPQEVLNQSAVSFVNDYFRLIDFILAKKSQVKIFVGGTPPFSGSFAGQDVLFQKTNPMIRDEIARRNDPRLVWVDVHKAFDNLDLSDFFYDGVHTNLNGEPVLADRWFKVISGNP